MSQKHHNTAAAFNGMTGLSLTANHIALVLRLSRVGGFWERQNDESGTQSAVLTQGKPEADPAVCVAPVPEAPSSMLPQMTYSENSNETEQCILAYTNEYIDGMLWQINVNPITRTDDERPFTLHYPSCPSVAEMSPYFLLYFAGTHHVHVRSYRDGQWVDRTYNSQKCVRRFNGMPEPTPFYQKKTKKLEREITEQLVREAHEELEPQTETKQPEKNAPRYLVTYYTGPGATATREYNELPTSMALAMFTNVHGKPTVSEIH